MALAIKGVGNTLFKNSKETGEGYSNPQNPPQNIANKEEEYSISTLDFQNKFSLIDDIERNNTAVYNREVTDDVWFYAMIHLANGIKIITCKIMGEDSTKSWLLQKSQFDGTAATTISTAFVNTEVTDINEIIDNKNHQYSIVVPLPKDKELWGGKIDYERNFI